jgi:DNA-binding CsgD family transcriptional regulator
MTDERMQAAIGALYEAAAGIEPWQQAGRALCRLIGADDVTLLLPDPATDELHELLRDPGDDISRSYIGRFHAADPFRAKAARSGAGSELKPLSAHLGNRLVPEPELIDTAYYQEFAGPQGRHHVLLGALAGSGPVAFYRPADARVFSEAERLLLQAVLPHLQRALTLQSRLRGPSRAAASGLAALDAVRFAVAVVDPLMRVVFANVAAERWSGSNSGLRLVRRGTMPASDMHLAAAHPEDDGVLRRLVANVAVLGGPGGGLRLRAPVSDEGTGTALALLVSPLPERSGAGRKPGRTPGFALLLFRDPFTTAAPGNALLGALFGLTAAEADVAAALVGGVTVEEVAQRRGVGFETVRSQVKIMLRKVGAQNLRDLERIIAALPGH